MAARSAGFDTVGVDLIYGTPEESDTSWRRTVDRVLALEPDHVSIYGLTFERGALFWGRRLRGELTPVDEELDWQTKTETGLGRIYVMPSSGDTEGPGQEQVSRDELYLMATMGGQEGAQLIDPALRAATGDWRISAPVGPPGRARLSS